ncbi:FAD-dependent cmnm(5)s(2)U34 oxidoreductase [Ventosimonas gracilis]|uniref:tRNA 5-methylaminomethyl-2-thiouridine biosynthesis bifunctional protein MnmC n=1 Tax=Ventosimonas gracilis TaxID=1680762 RepID=A0A139SX79_9GAMM|nr:bifunctional tRNA (5-methylaminomethyl-2-thiouridine)(34)-methyltransferase MnmD/FAD-dependent 5-carboxymethylaminomethyl-2-thiouridine(34) oxidoreductase MnmC [Ventosimonas gracilis]KXU39001.1 FAD-dependent cmnm(5)s(2)U34 oxidoreductase [Ventosimonas gracilis]
MSEHRPAPAQLAWDAAGLPYSAQFDDVYFSRSGGLTETQQVFIEGNDLNARFAALKDGQTLVIGETGFGTGLNFLCAWQLFEQLAPKGARLHFISAEKYPLSRADLTRALALWPSLKHFSDQLLANWRGIYSGFQRLVLGGGRVLLDLLLGDAATSFAQLDAQVDAWFLDGFTPAKNPLLWSEALFAQIARLSCKQATFATFTSAGTVRRGLQAAGFAVHKVQGFAGKREMLRGHLAKTAPMVWQPPWFARPPQVAGREVLVIGAGLAGCASAASLAARGYAVTLLERHGQIAAEGSGNPQGVLYFRPSPHDTPMSQWLLSGFGFCLRQLQLLPRGRDWDACGLLQLPLRSKDAVQQALLAEAFSHSGLLKAVSREEAEALAGVKLASGGLFYPDGAWVRPQALCRALIYSPLIELKLHQEALHLARTASGLWQVRSGNKLLGEAPLLVLANATEAKRFTQTALLPLKPIRGQLTTVEQTEASAALKTVLCGEGYISPALRGVHSLGASFNFKRSDLEPSFSEQQENLERLREISPDLLARLNLSSSAGRLKNRVALRCTSPDYLPLIGPLADFAEFARAYAPLSKNANKRLSEPCPWLDGLYVNCAHGARGLASTLLAGELLAAWINAEPLPVPRSVANACHPNRFALRRLIRGES